MNGVHDMGGLECYGAIDTGPDEKFHADWEKQVLAITLAMGATGTWNLDQSRFSRESLDPTQYLSFSYYQIWLQALESLLVKHELVTQEELQSGRVLVPPKKLRRVLKAEQVAAVLSKGAPVSRQTDTEPKFSVGDRVKVVNLHTSTHTRLPAYIRNHVGVIHKVQGAHIYPDSHANEQGENPQWLYNVQFEAAELWGSARGQHQQVHVDCWQPYLQSISQ